jgi:RNA polymerase-binding transcription factor DksA
MMLARKEAVSARIAVLQEAAARLDDGTYGYCENCGVQINPERLEILPAARWCINCARQQADS